MAENEGQNLIETMTSLTDALNRTSVATEALNANFFEYRGAAGTASKAAKELSEATEKVVKRTKEESESVKASTEAYDQRIKKLRETSDQLKGLESALFSLAGAFALPTKALDRMGNMFSSAFKTAGDFQNSVYLGAQKLRAYGGEFANFSKSIAAYQTQIDSVRKGTNLSRSESEKLVSVLNSGFKGDRTKNAIGQMNDLGRSVAMLTGNVEDSINMINKLSDSYHKFIEVRQAINEVQTTGLTQKTAAKMIFL